MFWSRHPQSAREGQKETLPPGGGQVTREPEGSVSSDLLWGSSSGIHGGYNLGTEERGLRVRGWRKSPMASSPRHRPTPVWTLPFPSGDPPPPGLWVQRHLAQCPLPGRTRDSTRKEEQTRAPSPRAAYRGFCHSPEPHQPGREGRATHWISRNARFSTSFTLYLRLNLQEGRERSVASKPTKCRGGRFPEALTPRCSPGDPHLALSRGSIMFLFWKLLKRSRRILPSGCGTQRGRPQLGGAHPGPGLVG